MCGENQTTIVRGNTHNCLSVKLDFSEPREVETAVCDCAKKLQDELPDDNCLSVMLDFSEPREVEIAVCNRAKKLQDELLDNMIGEGCAAVPEHLFKTHDSEGELLDQRERICSTP